MKESTPSRTISNVTFVTVSVVLVCTYALFFSAYETENWRGFWYSFAHVAIVGAGAWLALRKAC